MTRPAILPHRPGPAEPLPESQVRDQLARIVASAPFMRAERMTALLQFIVGEAIAGRADQLRGQRIAEAVFGRSAADSTSDTLVRVHAVRLRRALDHYHATAGQADTIRIQLPVGGYAPLITPARDLPASDVPARDVPASYGPARDGTAALAPLPGRAATVVIDPVVNAAPDPRVHVLRAVLARDLLLGGCTAVRLPEGPDRSREPGDAVSIELLADACQLLTVIKQLPGGRVSAVLTHRLDAAGTQTWLRESRAISVDVLARVKAALSGGADGAKALATPVQMSRGSIVHDTRS